MNPRWFKLHRNYSASFNLSNAGGFSWSFIFLRLQVQGKKKKIVVLCSRPPHIVKLGSFSPSSCSDYKEMYKKRDARAELIDLNRINQTDDNRKSDVGLIYTAQPMCESHRMQHCWRNQKPAEDLGVQFAKISNHDDDDDGNENVYKAIGLISKTTTLHVQHAFLYISL